MRRGTRTSQRRLWTPGRCLWSILVGFGLWSSLMPAPCAHGAAPGQVSGQITVHEGKLTARIAAVPLQQVMQEISQLIGVEVRWMDPQAGKQEVSVAFTALPVPEALRRLLRAHNFLLLSLPRAKGEPQPAHLWIASRDIPGEPHGHQPPAGVAIQPMPPGEEAASAAREAQDAVTLETLLRTAAQAQDPVARLDAIVRLGGHVHADPQVREMLSYLAHSDNNPQVQEAAAEVLMLADLE